MDIKNNRYAEKVITWIVWKLPKPLLYWAVVRAAVTAEPNANPADITAVQMMKKLEYR